MPSSAALPLAAVVTQFRIGTVLEPAQSTDITPSTTFRKCAGKLPSGCWINGQTLGLVSGFGH
jgi:hypothetical protein